MIFFKKFLFNRVFICYLTIAFLTLSFASSASAMFIPSPCEGDSTSHRETDLQKIQKLLESKLIEHKLSQFGLTMQEIEARLLQLDDEQIHQVASQINAMNRGAQAEPLLLILCIAALFVVLFIAPFY
jgi:hypothetical protein